MSQTLKFARVRTAIDPDRTPTTPGQFFGNNFPCARKGLIFPRHYYAIRYGAVVSPGTHPTRVQANHIVREYGVTGFDARRLLSACLPR